MDASVMSKATHKLMTYVELERRATACIAKGFQKQKWIIFCETLMDLGYKISLYEARQTVSKYVTVIGWDREFKVRFSNHKPIYAREAQGDCDFFVGVTNLGVTRMEDALNATKQFFYQRDLQLQAKWEKDSLSQGQRNSRSSREGQRKLPEQVLVHGSGVREGSYAL
jgi:hypothetical protein